MKRIEFIRLVSLSGLTLLAVPSCTDMALESTEQNLTDAAGSVGEEAGNQVINALHTNVGSRVPLSDARAWTSQFNSTNTGENYFHISREELLKLIESEDCNGIMFYLAENNESQMELVLGEVSKHAKTLGEDPFAISGTREMNAFK